MFKELGVKSFILKAIEEKGFKEPTPVQTLCIPALMEGKDVVVQARTGTGKTAAFAIPAIQKSFKREGIQVLILEPTRELTRQVDDEIMSLKKFIGLRIASVFGGSSIINQIRNLERGVEIIVGTPGRVKDLIDRGILKLEKVKLFVLDEADEMLDMGFIEDVEYIMSKLPISVQKGFFSATFPQEVMNLVERNMNEPEHINTIPPEEANTFTQQFYAISVESKYGKLKELLNEDGKFMIFCRTRMEADDLFYKLKMDGFRVLELHGGHTQKMRNMSIDTFRRWNNGILVATDVTARGLDIKGVTHTINYNIPEDIKKYVHRIGRTARAGHTGVAITIFEKRETRVIKELELITNDKMLPFESQDESILKQIRTDYYKAKQQNIRNERYQNSRNSNNRMSDNKFTGRSTTNKSSGNYNKNHKPYKPNRVASVS